MTREESNKLIATQLRELAQLVESGTPELSCEINIETPLREYVPLPWA